MSEAQYSNREIDRMIDSLKEHMTNLISPLAQDVGEIKVQTKKTNGRVSALEFWRAALGGSWIVVTLLVIPMITWIFFNQVEIINEKISDIKNSITSR